MLPSYDSWVRAQREACRADKLLFDHAVMHAFDLPDEPPAGLLREALALRARASAALRNLLDDNQRVCSKLRHDRGAIDLALRSTRTALALHMQH